MGKRTKKLLIETNPLIEAVKLDLPMASNYLEDGIIKFTIPNRKMFGLAIPRRAIQSKCAKKYIKDFRGNYFLANDNTVYTGISDGLDRRMNEQLLNRSFWDTAYIFTTEKNDLDGDGIKCLEFWSDRTIKKIDHYVRINEKPGDTAPLNLEKKKEYLDLFSTIKRILINIGRPFLGDFDNWFVLEGKGIRATGAFVDGSKFLVHKGSQAFPDFSDKIKHDIKYRKIVKKRQILLADDVLELKNGIYHFKKDQVFSTISNATTQVLGNSTNGWDVWFDVKGKKADVYRL